MQAASSRYMAIQCRASRASARSRCSPGSRSSTWNHLLPADELQGIAPGAKFRGALSPGQAAKDEPLALEHQAVARQEVTRHLVMPGRLEYTEAQHGCLPPPMRILDPCFDKFVLLAHEITLYSCQLQGGSAR